VDGDERMLKGDSMKLEEMTETLDSSCIHRRVRLTQKREISQVSHTKHYDEHSQNALRLRKEEMQ